MTINIPADEINNWSNQKHNLCQNNLNRINFFAVSCHLTTVLYFQMRSSFMSYDMPSSCKSFPHYFNIKWHDSIRTWIKFWLAQASKLLRDPWGLWSGILCDWPSAASVSMAVPSGSSDSSGLGQWGEALRVSSFTLSAWGRVQVKTRGWAFDWLHSHGSHSQRWLLWSRNLSLSNNMTKT